MIAGSSMRALLIASNGEVLTDAERTIFTKLTRRPLAEPLERVEELWVLAGSVRANPHCGRPDRVPGVLRRPSVMSSYWRRLLVLCLGEAGKQAAIVHGYVVGIIELTLMLAGLVKARSADSLSLTNGSTLKSGLARFRGFAGSLRLLSLRTKRPSGLRDQSWLRQSRQGDLAAVRPSLATTDGPLIAIRSSYSQQRRGVCGLGSGLRRQGDPLHSSRAWGTRDLNP